MSGGITRLEITRVESPTFEGRSFGAVGQYRKLVGRAYGEVDPSDPRNAVIADLGLAPRNAAGRVEYSTEVCILMPIEPAGANRRLFFDVTNRGAPRALGRFNDAPQSNDPSAAAEAGNGFLMEQGYALAWCGWDATARPGAGRWTITVPLATQPDGTPLTGPALEEFVVDDETTVVRPLTYPAASADRSEASLTVRARADDPPRPLPLSAWEYVDQRRAAIQLTPAGRPFERGMLYELTYVARDPLVAGLGFAALRDLAAFLRYADADEQGEPNPLAGGVERVYTFGSSQPSRTMHDFLWLGFNETAEPGEPGRQVFDGILNWIGGASGTFTNYRFAQPGRTHRQHIARHYPEFQFPFAYQVLFDPASGKTDGRLRRCLESGTCPKIFEVNSSNEYWAKAMATLHLDPAGNDLPDPPNVRFYLLASLPHGAGRGPGLCQQERNPLLPNPVLRALLVALDAWVTSGTEPPASRLPRRADGTLAPPLPQEGVGFPSIPNVLYNGRLHPGDLLDFGPLCDQGILTVLPPKLLGRPYPALVPRTDADGNDLAGIRLPDVAVPLATYTGWALRAFPSGVDEGADGAGQKIELARTRAERLASGDPRPSIEERYPDQAAYVSAVAAAARALRQQRLLLDDDVQAYIAAAEQSPVFRVASAGRA